MSANNIQDYDAITQLIQHYIFGAKSGKGSDMKPAFHDDATIYGYVGTDLFAGLFKVYTIGTMLMGLLKS